MSRSWRTTRESALIGVSGVMAIAEEQVAGRRRRRHFFIISMAYWHFSNFADDIGFIADFIHISLMRIVSGRNIALWRASCRGLLDMIPSMGGELL